MTAGAYESGGLAKLALMQRRLVSDRMWDRVMSTQYPRPGA